MSLADLRTQLAAGSPRPHGRKARCWLPAAIRCSAADPPEPSSGERFTRTTQTYAGVVADYQACGCHVHVGVQDRDTAVAVVNHLRRWLPTLLALSVNAPFERGRDTGYASWRTIVQQRFPGAGVPPHAASAAAYDSQVGRPVDCGVLDDQILAVGVWAAARYGISGRGIHPVHLLTQLTHRIGAP